MGELLPTTRHTARQLECIGLELGNATELDTIAGQVACGFLLLNNPHDREYGIQKLDDFEMEVNLADCDERRLGASYLIDAVIASPSVSNNSRIDGRNKGALMHGLASGLSNSELGRKTTREWFRDELSERVLEFANISSSTALDITLYLLTLSNHSKQLSVPRKVGLTARVAKATIRPSSLQ